MFQFVSPVDYFKSFLTVSTCQFFQRNHHFQSSRFRFCPNQIKFENCHQCECEYAKIFSICPIMTKRFQDIDLDADHQTHSAEDTPQESILQCQLQGFDGLQNPKSQILHCHFLKNCGKFHFYFVLADLNLQVENRCP